jgi:hypothetical protein
MPRYRYYVTTDPDAEQPPMDALPVVAADSPGEAVTKLENDGRLPIAGDGLYLRLVSNEAAYLLPISPDYDLPMDWQPED